MKKAKTCQLKLLKKACMSMKQLNPRCNIMKWLIWVQLKRALMTQMMSKLKTFLTKMMAHLEVLINLKSNKTPFILKLPMLAARLLKNTDSNQCLFNNNTRKPILLVTIDRATNLSNLTILVMETLSMAIQPRLLHKTKQLLERQNLSRQQYKP